VTKTRNSNTKGSAQQELPQFDENLDQNSEQIEDDFFNRKERLQQLEDGMIPRTNTILSAVFQEIKKQSDETRKRSTKKNKIHFFKVKPRLPVSISRISQAGKVRNSKDRIWLMQLSSSKRSSKSATQRPMWVCSKDSIASLHARSTRFPVW
jgi:hypothetical protein